MSWLLAIVGNVMSWLAGTQAWVTFAHHWLGYFTFRVFGYPKFPMADYFKVVDAFNKDPDAVYVFVSADTACLEWQAISVVTGGTWSHAGIVVMADDGLNVHHMKGDGRNYWHLLDVLRMTDNFAMMKLPLTKEQAAIAKGRLKSLLAAPSVSYNYKIEMDADTIAMLAKGDIYTPEQVPDTLYCSEEVYMIGAGLVPQYSLTMDLGRLRFEPDAAYIKECVVYEKRTVE